MFTGFSENGEILNESQNILLIFQKFHNPNLTQIKASLQVYYDTYQANKVTYDFISNILEEEAASIGDHPHQGVAAVNTCGEKSPESGINGAGGTIFTGFYPNWSKPSDREKQYIFDKRDWLNIKGVGNRKYFDKQNRPGLHPSSLKNKLAQKIQREISSLKAKCKELEEKTSASEEADEHQYNVCDHFCGK